MRSLNLKLLLLFTLSISLLSTTAFSQLGGQYTYGLLNLNTSARAGGLGGILIACNNPDISMVSDNPAYLGQGLHNQINLSYINYFADIQYGRVAYSYQTKKFGSFAAGIFYLNYGDFIEANEYGDITGEFQAAEYTFDLSWGYKIDSILSIGVNIRPIYSVLERYNSWGIATDAALLYTSPSKLTSAAFLIRNIGTQLSTYYSPNKEPLPFEIMAGFTQKIQHAPFRLSLTLRNLQKFDLDIIQSGEETDPTTGKKVYDKKFQEIASKSIDHIVAAVEFVPGKVFQIRFGYNFRNRAELKLGTRNTASGLTFGFGLNLGKFNLDYALANYHVAGVSHLMTLTTNLNNFY
ncbi:MAG: type IX secretion system protein PorQ [Bacteroidales bacterium]|nr:type IX secretion system protein PorQ [Bacteroidales bacterium]